MAKISITKTVDGVLVTPREASFAIKYLLKVRKSIKDNAELESRFDDFVRDVRKNREEVKRRA